MIYGLTSLGFIPKRLTDIVTELELEFRAAFGAGIETGPDSTIGKLIGVVGDREAALWEMLAAVWDSQYPNSASDISLARIGELTAVSPNPATKSTGILYVGGVNTTLVPAGSVVAVVDANSQFQTLADTTINGGQKSVVSLSRVGSVVTAEVTAHGLSAGRYVWINDAVETEYNGLHQITSIVDANNFTYTINTTPATPATGTISVLPATAVNLSAIDKGPVSALSGTLTEIVTSVSGWNRAENAEDVTKGTNAETDAAFRVRRIAALQGLGAATIDAIRGALLAVAGVSTVKVFENTQPTTVGSRPPHSIEALVVGGVNQDIFNTLFSEKSGGIETYGTTSGTVTDTQGNPHTIRFSRPASIPIYLEMDLTVDTTFPGVATVEARLLEFGDALDIGEDVVVFPALIGSIDDIPGILDVAVRIGTAAGPTLDDNIPIGETSVADFDSSRITVITV